MWRNQGCGVRVVESESKLEAILSYWSRSRVSGTINWEVRVGEIINWGVRVDGTINWRVRVGGTISWAVVVGGTINITCLAFQGILTPIKCYDRCIGITKYESEPKVLF